MSVANTWIHFITNNLYPTSADAFCSSAGQFNNRLFLFPLLHLGSGALPFSRTEWLELLFLFPFSLSYLMETGAKNKRPQALPRAKESVMIPTLLMNLPEPANNQSQYLLWLWVFPPSESLFLFLLFYLLFAAWKKAEDTGRHTWSRIEEERKRERESATWWQAGRHTHR